MTNSKLDLFDRIVKLMGKDPLLISRQQKLLLGSLGVIVFMGILVLNFYWLQPLLNELPNIRHFSMPIFIYLVRVFAYNVGIVVLFKFAKNWLANK